MRKRHAVQPVLESMENRMVLSVAGVATHAAEVAAARAEARAAHQATTRHSRSDTKETHHSMARAKLDTHHSSSKSSSTGSTIGNLLLKSIFPF
jgi:hypothetical protein